MEFSEREDLDAFTVFEDVPQEKLTAAQVRALGAREADAAATGTAFTRDHWGILWGCPPGGIVYPAGGPIRTAADLKTFRPPDPTDPARLVTLRKAVQRFKGRRAVVFLTHDGFEWPHYLRGGMEALFEDYVEDPDTADRVAELGADYKIRLMEAAIRAGADAVVSGDDYASANGLLMSPKHFRRFVLPHLKRSVEAAHRLGVPYIKHTDGDLKPILDDLVGAGIDALDPIEPAAGMDIGWMKQRYGDRLALVGNVDCSFVLPFGTEQDVEEAVKETIAKASPGGGHVLASSNTIHPAVKPANYRRMVETARRWGRYPIDPALIRDYGRKEYIATWRPEAGRRAGAAG